MNNGMHRVHISWTTCLNPSAMIMDRKLLVKIKLLETFAGTILKQNRKGRGFSMRSVVVSTELWIEFKHEVKSRCFFFFRKLNYLTPTHKSVAITHPISLEELGNLLRSCSHVKAPQTDDSITGMGMVIKLASSGETQGGLGK